MAPFDAHPDRGGTQHNLCTPEGQDIFFRLVWSWCVALAYAATPCVDMNMLKLRPGGPPAVYRPEAIDGWPGQPPARYQALQDSAIVHLGLIEALDAMWIVGGTSRGTRPRCQWLCVM